MITPEEVWEKVWPPVERLIAATLVGDDEAVKNELHPKGDGWQLHDLFGHHVFELLLKTVLGRTNLSVTRAIEADNGRAVYLELVWQDPTASTRDYSAADLVTVKLKRYRKNWRVTDINPAAVDLPLTETRAAGILANSQAITRREGLPPEAWILPVALLGGALQINLREAGLNDEVERLLLPGMQKRGYGIFSLLGARRMWRDYLVSLQESVKSPADWAAAVEFVANEQALREETQAVVSRYYGSSVPAVAARAAALKQALRIEGLDSRYTALQREQVKVNSPHADTNG